MSSAIVVRRSSLTIKEYLTDWLGDLAKLRVREATFDSYKFHLERYLIQSLGQHKLSKLNLFDIQKHYNSLSARYSPRTVRYVHTIFNNALKKAVATRILTRNPCDGAELPKQNKKELSVFTPDEARRFLAAAQNDERGIIFEFALVTGARPEEYLALKWQDIDWEKKLAVFHRTVRWRKGGGWYLDEGMKTKLSRRTIPLPPSIIERLRSHRTKQAQEIVLLGPAYERMDFVFANGFGRPLHYGNITKRNYQRILKEARLGHFTLYSLRHSCATLLLRNGVNIKVIQERLGHSDINLTLSVYAHVLEGMQAEASDNMQALLYGT
jgi:integrase